MAALVWSVNVMASEFNPAWGIVGVFTEARTCASCHRASIDNDPAIPAVMRYPLVDSGEDVSPSAQWAHSMMAHAFDDPYYQAKVADETAVFPAIAGLIEDKCLTCHAPMGRTHAHQSATDLTVDASCTLPDGCYRLDTASSQDHAREGVSCTLCHQVRADGLGTSASFSGAYSIAATTDPDALRIYGHYASPVAAPMLGNTIYTPQFGSQMTTSSHCASCHTLFTPTVDIDTGTPTGGQFLEQGPFLEWQNSVYFTGNTAEKQCQDCHMPDPDPGLYSTRIAVRPAGSVNEGWPERSPFLTHDMVGGNSYMLALLRDNRDVLEIENSTSEAGFDTKIAQTRALLENAAAVLDITRAVVSGDELAVDVQVTNRAGHKLPTAYPSRRMWIHLTARGATGQLVFESGAPDAQGRLSTDGARLATACLAIVKPPGFNNDDCFEPHRDVIDDASQIAIYETVMKDSNGHITHVLLHSASYLKDNRIPPQGFTNDRADSIEPQTRPAGTGGDGDFNVSNSQEGSGTDTVHYRIAANGQNAPYSIEARLLYQAIQPAFVLSMHSDDPRVDRFKTMVQDNPPDVEVLASSSVTSTSSPGGGSDSGGSSGGGCTINTDARAGVLFPVLIVVMLAVGLVRPGLRRFRNKV